MQKDTPSSVLRPLVHSVSFASSGGKKIGKPHKKSFDLNSKQYLSDEECIPPTKRSDVGTRSTPISPAPSPLSPHRTSCAGQAVRCRIPVGSEGPPSVLHLNLEHDPVILTSPSIPLFLEENKETKVQTDMEEVSGKSTLSETPHECHRVATSTSLWRYVAAETKGKEEPEFHHCAGTTQRRPAMLALSEKELSKIVTGATTGDLRTFAPSGSSASMQAYREFLYYLFESVCLMKQIAPGVKALPAPAALDLKRPDHVGKEGKTVVFDLDETLIHGVEKWQPGDIEVSVPMPDGETSLEGVNIRPHLIPVLEEISKKYEVIVFTSSYKEYADAILDCIDKDRRLIHHRLYREHCVKLAENLYIKDLRVLGRDLTKVIMVDNTPYAFAAQTENGYPIVPYYDDRDDRELVKLAKYLREIRDVEDVRKANGERFKLAGLAKLDVEQYAQYYRRVCGEDHSQRRAVEETIEFSKLQQSLKHFFKDWK